MDTVPIGRRKFLVYASAVPFAARGFLRPAHAAINFADPEEGHKANVKLRGSLQNEWVWRHYWGESYAVLPNGAPIPLYKFEGLIKAKWTDNGDGTHTELLFDLAGHTDWETGELLERFENPITGVTNQAMHIWDGPNATTYSKFGPIYPWTVESPKDPVALPWKVIDGSVWLTERGNFERPHPLDPAEWPLASSGPKTVSMVNVTLTADLTDLENANLVSAPHSMKWTAMRSWMPWLLLGQRPGLMLTIGMGRKISGPTAISGSMKKIIDSLQPNYLTSEQPWADVSNSWTRYKSERDPIKN